MRRDEFMVDTGCPLNLIKWSSLKPGTQFDKDVEFELVGIGDGVVRTLGQIKIKIGKDLIDFQVVPDNFTIGQNGILGSQLLKDKEATLKFYKNGTGSATFDGKIHDFISHATLNLPARTKKLITLPVKGNMIKAYLPRVNLGDGVFLGESLVTQENGHVKCFAINTTQDDIQITFPAPEIEEFETVLD